MIAVAFWILQCPQSLCVLKCLRGKCDYRSCTEEDGPGLGVVTDSSDSREQASILPHPKLPSVLLHMAPFGALSCTEGTCVDNCGHAIYVGLWKPRQAIA